MKPGWHAPAKGSRTGVADYAETLGAALGRIDADVHVYHIGNNKLHHDIYLQALRTPGIVVLHDAVLQHFMLGTCSREEYLAEWIHNYGVWRTHLGEELWDERAKSAVDPRYFQFPMLRRIVEASRAVIVHNPGAAGMARAHGAQRVFTIPHFYQPQTQPGASDGIAFRQRFGIDPAATLFGIFGYLRETKRVPACIAAFRKLNAVEPRTALLLAGDAVSRDLARLLETEAVHPHIYRAPHLSERDLGAAISAVNCCLNLRYPAAGETSGIAIRLMGAGRPVIGTDNEENSAIPETAMLRVRPGIAEQAELFDHMSLVALYPGIAREVAKQAQVHIGKCHDIEIAVRQYREVICAATS